MNAVVDFRFIFTQNSVYLSNFLGYINPNSPLPLNAKLTSCIRAKFYLIILDVTTLFELKVYVQRMLHKICLHSNIVPFHFSIFSLIATSLIHDQILFLSYIVKMF